MENKTQDQIMGGASQAARIKKDRVFPVSIVISATILAGAWMYTADLKVSGVSQKKDVNFSDSGGVSALEERVLPSDGVVLPVVWGDLGIKLVEAGAIDAEKFRSIYEQKGSFTDEYEYLLSGDKNGRIKITNWNSAYLLNLFWALGLANKNPILDLGEMKNPAYGGAENFASTAGWTMAKGDAMEHYSRHKFFTLTAKEQALVDKVSGGIYRPCCGNSARFPDCNHGMAMLGLLELMASQGASEEDMWKTAMTVNSYWFPDTYLTIATYMENKGIQWKDADPKEILGASYSSAAGYRKIAEEVVQPPGQQKGK